MRFWGVTQITSLSSACARQFPRPQLCSLASVNNHQWGAEAAWGDGNRDGCLAQHERGSAYSSGRYCFSCIPSFLIPFQITPFPRGSAHSRLLLLITHGPRKCSSCWEKWDQGWAGGAAAAQVSEWETGAWLKVFSCLGGQRKRNSKVLEEVHLGEWCEKVLLFGRFIFFFSDQLPIVRPVPPQSVAAPSSSIRRSDKDSQKTMQSALEKHMHWSLWLDCLLYGLNDWQFDNWQTDTDWSIGA